MFRTDLCCHTNVHSGSLHPRNERQSGIEIPVIHLQRHHHLVSLRQVPTMAVGRNGRCPCRPPCPLIDAHDTRISSMAGHEQPASSSSASGEFLVRQHLRSIRQRTGERELQPCVVPKQTGGQRVALANVLQTRHPVRESHVLPAVLRIERHPLLHRVHLQASQQLDRSHHGQLMGCPRHVLLHSLYILHHGHNREEEVPLHFRIRDLYVVDCDGRLPTSWRPRPIHEEGLWVDPSPLLAGVHSRVFSGPRTDPMADDVRNVSSEGKRSDLWVGHRVFVVICVHNNEDFPPDRISRRGLWGVLDLRGVLSADLLLYALLLAGDEGKDSGGD